MKADVEKTVDMKCKDDDECETGLSLKVAKKKFELLKIKFKSKIGKYY